MKKSITSLLFSLCSISIAAAAKPNIVLILADDMTWSDCEPYGSTNVPTPNLLKLAEQGMRFDNMFTSLLPLANKTLTAANMNGMEPALTGATCNTSDMYNWGEPYRNPPVGGAVTECDDYFPIMYRNGDYQVQAGRGQGILLVEGDFQVAGNFIFNGIIIAKGKVTAHGTGNKVTGAVFAKNADLEVNAIIGNPQIIYSSCAISQVLLGAARAVPLASPSLAGPRLAGPCLTAHPHDAFSPRLRDSASQ